MMEELFLIQCWTLEAISFALVVVVVQFVWNIFNASSCLETLNFGWKSTYLADWWRMDLFSLSRKWFSFSFFYFTLDFPGWFYFLFLIYLTLELGSSWLWNPLPRFVGYKGRIFFPMVYLFFKYIFYYVWFGISRALCVCVCVCVWRLLNKQGVASSTERRFYFSLIVQGPPFASPVQKNLNRIFVFLKVTHRRTTDYVQTQKIQ